MKPEQRNVAIAMLEYAAERWTAGDLKNAEKLCRCVWAVATTTGDFTDTDTSEADR